LGAIYWLGAHKTGTTFLQKCLDLSVPALNDHGIYYTELEEFRTRYARPLLNQTADEVVAEDDYDDRKYPTRLVFDENIPGYVQHALSVAGFYPEAVQRSARIARHLDLEVHDVVFGVRSYDTFLPSLYCETLKSTPFRTFDQYLKRSFRVRPTHPNDAGRPRAPESPSFDRMNWRQLVGRLASAYPDARVRVYFHEQLRGNEARLLAEVLGLNESEITILDTLERTGFSGRAVEELHTLSVERTVTRADVRRAVRRFPAGKEFPTYYPWDESDRELLRRNYEQDSKRLRSDPRLEIIKLD